MKTINKIDALKLAKLFDINLYIIPFEQWHYGLNVELEHGTKYGKLTNITNDNKIITGKIVIAHLLEDPMYYKRLKKMEQTGIAYWKNKKKPNIFIH